MITLDKQIGEEQRLLGDTRKMLHLLREEIEDFREHLACRDEAGTLKPCPNVNRLKTLYDNCLDTENRLGKCKELKAGIVQNGVAFDLSAARDSIGRKLDRLRDAAQSDAVSR